MSERVAIRPAVIVAALASVMADSCWWRRKRKRVPASA